MREWVEREVIDRDDHLKIEISDAGAKALTVACGPSLNPDSAVTCELPSRLRKMQRRAGSNGSSKASSRRTEGATTEKEGAAASATKDMAVAGVIAAAEATTDVEPTVQARLIRTVRGPTTTKKRQSTPGDISAREHARPWSI